MELQGIRDIIAHYNSSFEELKSSIIEVKSSIQEIKSSMLLLHEIRKVLNHPLYSRNSALSPTASSSLSNLAESTLSKRFELQIKGVPESFLTMTKLDDEGTSVEVELLDDSGNRVEDGIESNLKIKIDVLNGDFDVEDKVDWTKDDYIDNIAKPRDGKGPLLKGKCKMGLNRGVAGIGHLCFTNNSKSMRNGTFRLGASAENCPLVKPAVSEAFKVKERRLKSDMKHKVPNPEDELFRLIHIRKNGAIHAKALKAGIRTVEDFNRHYDSDAKGLQHILGVHDANWEKIVKNAKECKLHHRTNESCINKNVVENYEHNSEQQEPEQLKQPPPLQQSPLPLQAPLPPNGDFDAGGLCNSSNATVALGMENDTVLTNENTVQKIVDYGTDYTNFGYDQEDFDSFQAILGGINFEPENYLLDLTTLTADGIGAVNLTDPTAQSSLDSNKLRTKYCSLFLMVKLVMLVKRFRSRRRNREINRRPQKKQKI